MALRVVPTSFAAALAVAAAFAGIASACGATTDETTPDAATIDGPSGDAATSDAPAIDGALGDGGDGGAGDSGHFCTTLSAPHDFCEDFEEPLFFGTARWTRPSVAGAGRLSVENGILVSEVLEHDAGDSYNPATLILERDWSVPLEKDTRRLALAYRSKVEHCNAILPISFLGGVDRGVFYSYTVYVVISQGVDCTASVAGFYYEPDGGAVTYIQPGAAIPISIGSFVDYAITLQEISGTTTFVLQARGMTSSTSFPSIARGDIITVLLGASRPWLDGRVERLDFDDILFDDGR